MKVSTREPYKVIYSLFKHEFLGYLFESFAIQEDDKGNLTLKNQNISYKNARDFGKDLDERDYRAIQLMDSIQQEPIHLKFQRKKLTPEDFFFSIFDKEKGDAILRETIERYVEEKLSEILSLLPGKPVFIMGKNGFPNWKPVTVEQRKASVLFHFRRNEENTHYFPTVKFNGEKVEFQYNNSQIICNKPGWLLLEDKIISFEKNIDGKKIKPFLNKKFVAVPRKIEENYFKNFVTPLVEKYDVYAKGFEINTEIYDAQAELVLTETESSEASMDLFKQKEVEVDNIRFDLSFRYGEHSYPLNSGDSAIKVEMEKNGDDYVFHRIKRNKPEEIDIEAFLRELELPLKHGKTILPKTAAYSWITKYQNQLRERQIDIIQKNRSEKTYFIGEVSLDLEIKENNDWFDIHGVVRFGEFEIEFLKLKKYILGGKKEFILPNGQTAVIPEEWFADYLELFAFANDEKGLRLKQHHASLVETLREGKLAKVMMSRKLEKLRDIERIDEYEVSERFKGELRPYQKSGYNWLCFLDEYNLGGCLADDMGLGKTVQTLALLQNQLDNKIGAPSLLVLPTSLVYNWQLESKKFCPDLRVFTHTGTKRSRNTAIFDAFDLIITTYGTLRIDIEILNKYKFNYVILDESQKIKNPNSNTTDAVRQLVSRRKLILTGTPIENTTLDLWSQMTFVNPGLLGDQAFFKKEFQHAIEKKADEDKSLKLYSLVKPFILRRKKEQVAHDLPEKIETVQYCEMSESQESMYEETKSHYRNTLLQQIDEKGLGKAKFMLLQGLTKLRQIANHPLLTDKEYEGDSGKMNEVLEKMESALDEGHKILVFSQFVQHLAIVKKELTKRRIPFTYLDGATKDRQQQVEKFQTDERIKVFLISLKAGGVGLNLTAADYVFILDPWWNPAVEAQAVDRAHRIGQERTVFTYKFISKNTVEEKILALQNRKLKLVQDLISIDENVVKNLTKEDIEVLLE